MRIKYTTIREGWAAQDPALRKHSGMLLPIRITVGGAWFWGHMAQAQTGIDLGGPDTRQRRSMTWEGTWEGDRKEGGMADHNR